MKAKVTKIAYDMFGGGDAEIKGKFQGKDLTLSITSSYTSWYEYKCGSWQVGQDVEIPDENIVKSDKGNLYIKRTTVATAEKRIALMELMARANALKG